MAPLHGHRSLATCWGLAVGALLAAGAASAYTHHTGEIRFQEPSPAVFDLAARDGKPVFMLISAVWCYWCKTFEQDTLRAEHVAGYLNRAWLNVFVDHDRHPDLVRKHVRGLPMVVLFGPDGRVRQSFAGALKTQDFLDVLNRVESDVRSTLARASPAEPPPSREGPAPAVPVSADAYRHLVEALARYVDEQADTTHGGFGAGSKAPHGRLLALLAEHESVAPDRRRAVAIERTLDGSLRGLYDAVEGGFFHYAAGRDWSDPRYEKLLHVNAALLVALDSAHRMTRKRSYREAANATAAYVLRTLYDRRQGGFFNSQTADPAYYRLSATQRRAAPKPPVNRDKLAASNGEAIVAFLAVGQSAGRQDLRDAALSSLELMRQRFLTDRGVYHMLDGRTGAGQLRGQLEANAWAALAFLDGHRVSGRAVYRAAAERVIGYALAELVDLARGVFVDASSSGARAAGEAAVPLEANGVMALALVRAHQATGRAEYRDAARRALATLGGRVNVVFAGEPEMTSVKALADTALYLRAYGELVREP